MRDLLIFVAVMAFGVFVAGIAERRCDRSVTRNAATLTNRGAELR